jgi:hypothetical protein
MMLSMQQLSKAVHLFSRNVHDASLPLTVLSIPVDQSIPFDQSTLFDQSISFDHRRL